MRKWIEKILPVYSVLPLILAVSINMLVYFWNVTVAGLSDVSYDHNGTG